MELEKVGATISNVKLYTANPYLVRDYGCNEMSELTEEPEGMPDLIIVTAKMGKGKVIQDVFTILIKYDGTLEKNALTKKARQRRARLISFLKYYKITKDIKKYNLPKNLGGWKDKKIEVVDYLGKEQIFIPGHLIRDGMLKKFD